MNGAWNSVSCPSACTPPPIPTSSSAGSITCTSFTANWAASTGAGSYFLDVATDVGFTTFAPGYINLNVGNLTSYSVLGLNAGTTYYYRVRAATACTSGNSSPIQVATLPLPAQPSVITGTATVTQGINSVAYAVTNVADVAYTWSYSGSGYTQASGGTTNSILANFSASATSGTLTVTPSNTCGNGTVQTYAITISTYATLTTNAAGSVSAFTATSGGDITAGGGSTVIARGVCWSTSQNPTIADSKTSDGSGTGSYSSSITGLTQSTTYYVRSFATNGVGTSYGNEVSFISGTPANTVNYAYNGSTQSFAVPAGITSIKIEARGAAGTDVSPYSGGKGAYMSGIFPVTPGESITILVGQQVIRSSSWSTAGGGGGGGTFLWHTDILMLAAGGGGGASGITAGADAQNTTSYSTCIFSPYSATGGAVGYGGSGGNIGSAWAAGGGGAGWLSNGAAGASKDFSGGGGGYSPLNGGGGGTVSTGGDGTLGGYGGGGGASETGGGGGGYTGGGGGNLTYASGTNAGGGGAGSYIINTATKGTCTSGANSGNGSVIISY